MPKVIYVAANGNETIVNVNVSENVMSGALYSGIDGIIGECGGGLACATCHIYVDDAWAGTVGGPASQEERDMLEMTASEIRPESRLSCQIVMSDALDGLIVHLPEAQY